MEIAGWLEEKSRLAQVSFLYLCTFNPVLALFWGLCATSTITRLKSSSETLSTPSWKLLKMNRESSKAECRLDIIFLILKMTRSLNNKKFSLLFN